MDRRCLPGAYGFMEHRDHDSAAELQRPDIRRRLRESKSAPEYTLVVLFDAMRSRKRPLRGSTIALFGFTKDASKDAPRARMIRETLKAHGVVLRSFDPKEHADVTPRSLDDALIGVSAAVIATDSRVFRLVSRKDFRARGIDIVIPTTLQGD